MSIVYNGDMKTFCLSGGDVSYVLHVDGDGHLMNLYWGKRVPDGAVVPALENYPGGASFDLPASHLPWEIPTRGRGWYGTPAVGAVNAAGDDVVDLTYVSHEIMPGKKKLEGLPATYVEDDGEADTLEITLKDALTGLVVKACYAVYAASGAITRSMILENSGAEAIDVTGLMAASAPLYGNEYDIIHLKGGWAKERRVVRTALGEGDYRIFSQRGASGHEENPFVALCDRSATEFQGRVWALNFVYSGSFLAGAAVDNLDNSRMYMGMNPETFRWRLEAGEKFQSPEAVMVFTDSGFNGMSHIFHGLYRTRLVRGQWRDRVRPVLINNWEGTYFDFNEEKILEIARRAKDIGVELFVLDDGWFGKRNKDNCSLGDWVVNTQKLPNGINGLADKINELGMKFGLWFEPEMVSPDSDLYRAHPDWCLHVDGRSRTEARQQLILDLSRSEVQDYVIGAVSAVLDSARIGYVKWDMNRNMTEHFSAGREPGRQLETQHRYMLGLYRVLEEITSRFPEVLFESCSGGGGRFDAGMLYYMPQTWTSDDTDAVERLAIQYGTSMVYPASAMGAHVSAVPNHQTGRVASMRMRGDVALGGNFGFELDLSKLSDEDTAVARQLVEDVKKVRGLTQKGAFTRLMSPFEGQYTAWQFAAEDEALLCVYRVLTRPNTAPIRVRMQGLDEAACYADDDGNVYSGAVLVHMGMWIKLDGDFSSRVVHLSRVK
jgi:alpha-galactosidase